MVPSNTQLQSIIAFIAVRGTICIQASTNCAATPSKWLQASYNLMIVRGKRAQINTAVISHSVDDRVWLCIIRFERIWQHNLFALQIYPSTWRPTNDWCWWIKVIWQIGALDCCSCCCQPARLCQRPFLSLLPKLNQAISRCFRAAN